MLLSITRVVCLFLTLMLSCAAFSAADTPTEKKDAGQIEPFVDLLIKQVSEYLDLAQSISVHSETTYEQVLTSGQKIQLHREAELIARRPDRLRAEVESDEGIRRIYFNGKSISLFDMERNVYALLDAPGTTEQAFDLAMEKFQVEVPLADFFVGNLYDNFITQTDSGFYAGLHYLQGKKYHHLALSNDKVDFQVWISDDFAPLIHKVVINYKNLPGAPQQTTTFSNWTFNPTAPDMLFDFYPPMDAEQIEFLPVLSNKEKH